MTEEDYLMMLHRRIKRKGMGEDVHYACTTDVTLPESGTVIDRIQTTTDPDSGKPLFRAHRKGTGGWMDGNDGELLRGENIRAIFNAIDKLPPSPLPKDSVGEQLHEGDHVAFLLRTGRMSSTLCTARVAGITPPHGSTEAKVTLADAKDADPYKGMSVMDDIPSFKYASTLLKIKSQES